MLQLAGLPIYFENSIGRLYEHPDDYAILDYKAGKRQLSTYQAFLQHLENLLKSRGWNKMLANQRLLTPFTDEERLWIREQWLVVSHALQREMIAAVLLPEDVFARLGMNQLMQDARERALVYRIFNNAQEAAAWLLKVT